MCVAIIISYFLDKYTNSLSTMMIMFNRKGKSIPPISGIKNTRKVYASSEDYVYFSNSSKMSLQNLEMGLLQMSSSFLEKPNIIRCQSSEEISR